MHEKEFRIEMNKGYNLYKTGKQQKLNIRNTLLNADLL